MPITDPFCYELNVQHSNVHHNIPIRRLNLCSAYLVQCFLLIGFWFYDLYLLCGAIAFVGACFLVALLTHVLHVLPPPHTP